MSLASISKLWMEDKWLDHEFHSIRATFQYALYLGIIIFPHPASNLMTTQIKGLKLKFSNTQLFRSGVLSRLMLDQFRKLKHHKLESGAFTSSYH